jgi:hypothetical protein
MKVDPGLDIIAICPGKSFLGCLQVRAACVAPAAFANERIPNFDFFFAGFSAASKTPVENFLIRSSLKSSSGELIVIDSKKPGAARVEESRIFDAEEIAGSQSSRRVEANFVEHSRKVDKTFGLAITATGSLHGDLLTLPSSFVHILLERGQAHLDEKEHPAFSPPR